jgi:hypothetical protein
MMPDGSVFQSVSLVARGGVPVTLTDAFGTPYPTTGYGALVFNHEPVLYRPELHEAIFVDTDIPTPLTTEGDLYYYGPSGPTRLPRGSAGQVLRSTASTIEWSSGPGTGTVTQINIGTGLAGAPSPITSIGTISIADTPVIANAYGSATMSPTYVVNAQGQLVDADDVLITPAVTSITGLAVGMAAFLATWSNAALIGVPTAPTAAVGTDTTQIATTAFVQANATRIVSNLTALKALTARPATVQMLGYTTVGDVGAGPAFVWLAGSVLTPDDGIVVQCTSGPAGRYVRMFDGALSVFWYGCGLGAADDSIQFQKAVNNYLGRAVDVAGATCPINGILIDAGTTGPGVYDSEGTGRLINAPGSTINTVMFQVQATHPGPYYFRGLTTAVPVSADPVVSPLYSRTYFFITGACLTGAEVTDCFITGGVFGVVANGSHAGANFSRNTLTGTWSDGISGPDAPDGCFICDNTLFDGGYCTGVLQPGGAIRIGSSTQTAAGQQTSICRNHIARYSVGANQDAIDCTSGGAFNLDVSDNVIELCGSGIEFKTIVTALVTPDIYQGIKCANNIVLLRHDATSSVGVSLNLTGAAVASGKAAKIVIQNNLIWCLQPATNSSIYAFTLLGYNDVDYRGNTVINTGQGISISATGVVDTTAYRLFLTGGNKWDCVFACIGHVSGTTNVDVTLKDSVFKARVNSCVSFASSTTINLLIDNCFIWGVNAVGVELRDNTNVTIRDSVIVGGTSPILSQVTGPTNCLIENNRLYSTWDMIPAISGTVTNPGAGLTDGTRLFTVTNGTLTPGSLPTIFSCLVAGGVITGPVVIVQAGGYTTFPAIPVVTVDSGVVGGATFTLTGASAGSACNMGSGTGTVIRENSVNVPANQRTVIGAGTYLTARNNRGVLTANPTGTYAGSIGDVFSCGTPAALGGVTEWTLPTAGAVGVTWWPNPPGSSSVAPAALGAPVLLNNTGTFFNGPNTGSIGVAGQVWLIMANFAVSQSSAGVDYYTLHIWNGAAVVGEEVVVASAGAGVNAAGVCFAIVTLAAATTFTLRAKDVTTVDGSLLDTGTSITAIRLS